MNAALVRKDLWRSINSRQKDIREWQRKAFEVGCGWHNDIVLQGADLIKLQSGCRQTEWRDEIASNGQDISLDEANHFIRVASKQSDRTIEDVRQLFLDITLPEPRIEQPRKILKPHTEAMGKFSNAYDYERKHPFETWPVDAQEQFRDDLLPLALKVWPENFTKHIPAHD